MLKRLFPDMRQTSRGVLLLFVAVDYLLVTLVILLFASGLLVPLVQASGGLFNRTLLANVPLLVVVVGGVMLWRGKLRAGDLGLVWTRLLAGLAFTAGLWLLVQITQLALALAANGTVTPAPAWSELGILAVLGTLIGQLFGNALYEEIGYRGFLLPQVWTRLNHRWPGRSTRGLVVALLVTQGLFALRHLPGSLLEGLSGADLVLNLLRVLGIGVLYALLYLRTNNLFLVIGVHALGDASTPLFTSTLVGSSTLVLVFAAVALLVWPLFTRQQGKRPHLGVAVRS
jgi:membrane protease YdiL (CAAX protease family)